MSAIRIPAGAILRTHGNRRVKIVSANKHTVVYEEWSGDAVWTSVTREAPNSFFASLIAERL